MWKWRLSAWLSEDLIIVAGHEVFDIPVQEDMISTVTL